MDKFLAINRAADFIEANPHRYDFWGIGVPDDRCPACMWGWIGKFIDLPAHTKNRDVARAIEIRSTSVLYDLRKDGESHDAKSAVIVLRRFAQQFKPAPPIAEPLEPAYLSWRTSLRQWKPVSIAASVLIALIALVR